MRRYYQVMKVTGKGFMQDENVATYADLSEDLFGDLKTAHKVAHIGEMKDFLDVDSLGDLSNKPEDVRESELAKLHTLWKGKPLAVGTVYCVTFSDDPTSEAAALKAIHVKKVFAQERFVQAGGPKAFQSPAGQDAMKNVGQAPKTPGGVWGQKRPRV
jgi:hypothetical protein